MERMGHFSGRTVLRDGCFGAGYPTVQLLGDEQPGSINLLNRICHLYLLNSGFGRCLPRAGEIQHQQKRASYWGGHETRKASHTCCHQQMTETLRGDSLARIPLLREDSRGSGAQELWGLGAWAPSSVSQSAPLPSALCPSGSCSLHVGFILSEQLLQKAGVIAANCIKLSATASSPIGESLFA